MSIGHCGGDIVKTGSLMVHQAYEVDRILCGIQENLCIRQELLIKIQVTGYPY